jgi:hypothetical protein
MRWTLALVMLVVACDRLLALEHFGPVDAPGPRPDLPVDVCGVVGAPCCDATTCSDGSSCLAVANRTRCIAFAGTYQTSADTQCGAACLDDDRFAGGCACPSGFTSVAFDIDEGCGPPALPANATGTVTACTSTTLPPNSDWAGMYVQADIADCEPTTSNGCIVPNAITSSCACPPDAERVALRIFVPGTPGPTCSNGYLGATLGVCLARGVAQASVVGVYQLDADTTCRTYSSGLSGCACPAGSIVSQLRTIEEAAGAGSGFTPVESTIAFCLIAP